MKVYTFTIVFWCWN